MIRYWIGTALLAGSWLFGLGYFYPAAPWAWFAAIAAAVVLLGGNGAGPFSAGGPPGVLRAAALLLFLPAVWFAPWPYRASPLLIALGLAFQLLPIRKRWSERLAHGAVVCGVILLAQALALELYADYTMRSHDLPWPLPDMLAGIAAMLGVDAAADGSTVVMHSMRQAHRLGATWELLLDPATFLFFIGGLTMLACGAAVPAMRAGETPATQPQPVEGGGECGRAAPRFPCSAPRWRAWIGGLRTLTVVILAWLPLRAGLLMAVYLHRVLRSDPDRPLHAMNHFFSPWTLLLLLVVPVLLAWRFVRLKYEGEAAGDKSPPQPAPALPSAQETKGRAEGPLCPSSLMPSPSSFSPQPSFVFFAAAAVLIALAAAIFTAAIYWNPVGTRKGGRVMFVERHSRWEPTTKPYDTTWFVKPELFPDVNSGYNYARIYRYLGQFYEMSRLNENDKIDDNTLAKCDVLVIKTPTERYSPAEVDAVLRFVELGGGLLLVGDHTNVFRSATIMNDVTRRMGFIFRDDLLFSFGKSPYDELYLSPLTPHPIVQYFQRLDFAVSCSIDPGSSRGRAAMVNTGLWSMGPEYHAENFHPVPQHCPEMRCGAFIQAWAAQYGKGRTVAFTDSTDFSNFCVGQPGKSEVMLGMIEWLNHAPPLLDSRPWLLLLGLVPLAVGLWMAFFRLPKTPAEVAVAPSPTAARPAENLHRHESPLLCNEIASGGGRNFSETLLVLLAAGTFGWVVASVAVAAVQRSAMPVPGRLRPQRCVVIDRTFSTVPLSIGPDTQGNGKGYGLMEQWLARLDCYTVRKEAPESLSGDVLVVICPSRSVSEGFRGQVAKYVESGGKLLLIDSPENINSSANGLLWPFGLSIHHDREWKGKLTTGAKLPKVDVARACEVVGGQPAALIGAYPVAATVRHGKGAVMAIGFGALWNDKRMGENWMLEPDATVKTRFDALFGLLGPFFEGKALPPAISPPADKPKEGKDLGPKESGPAVL